MEGVGRAVGYIERPSSEWDVAFPGLGIVVGGLIGLLTLTVGGLPLTLTASGGALMMGLVFGIRSWFSGTTGSGHETMRHGYRFAKCDEHGSRYMDFVACCSERDASAVAW